MRARLKHGELYALQLPAAALFRQQLEEFIVRLSQLEGILSRTLGPTTVASAHVSNSAAVFSNGQLTANEK